MTIQSQNPLNGNVERAFEEWLPAHTSSVIHAVATAYTAWKDTSFAQRSKCLASLAAVLRTRAVAFARIMAQEMGKPVSFGKNEIIKCADACDYYAQNGEAMLAPRPVDGFGKKTSVEFHPMGTVLAVMPWNFPFWQVIRIAAPTLMAGNTMVLKHASNVPQCALAIENAFKESDFPPDVFRTLLAGSRQVESILDHASIVGVSLTGSEAAGRKVAQAAGARLKKSIMELGGSDPFVVLADADLQQAARIGALSRCANAGQTCIAAKRFIVHRDVYEDFLAALCEAMDKLKVGSPLDEDTIIGPMASHSLRKELHDQVLRCEKAGGRIIKGGCLPDGDGAFYPLTVIRDAPFSAEVCREEFFGPVALVFRADNDEHAMALANDTPFGLGGSVWTGDEEKGLRLARRIEAGIVFVNGLVRSAPTVPFGGVKHSGYGRELAAFGILEFVNIKTVCLEGR